MSSSGYHSQLRTALKHGSTALLRISNRRRLRYAPSSNVREAERLDAWKCRAETTDGEAAAASSRPNTPGRRLGAMLAWARGRTRTCTKHIVMRNIFQGGLRVASGRPAWPRVLCRRRQLPTVRGAAAAHTGPCYHERGYKAMNTCLRRRETIEEIQCGRIRRRVR